MKEIVVDIRTLFHRAIEQFGSETGALEFLPENRYNKTMFPTTGQYDWFSGQLLYCLIRYLKPDKILEMSTASGYSTMFMAIALKKNGQGKLDTYELDAKAANAAAKLFKQHQLVELVNLHVGDARKLSKPGPLDYDIYFLDSLHTEAFAHWFIETHVMPTNRRNALFHMHDILPRHARVRCWNAPPVEGTPLDPNSRLSWNQRLKRAMCALINPEQDQDDEQIPIRVYPPAETGVQTYDGNCTTEAMLGNDLAALMKPENFVFLYDIANDYPQLSSRKYDSSAIGRTDCNNVPMEWNESWWCKVTALKAAYHSLQLRNHQVLESSNMPHP